MNIKSIGRIYEYWLDWSFRAKIISALLNVVLCTVAVLVIVNYLTNVKQATEQVGAQFITLGDQTAIRVAEKVSEETKLLQTLATTPSIVAAVKQANYSRASWTPQMIALQDNAWLLEDPSIETTLQEIAGNQISTYLIDFQSIDPAQVEVFITDRYGLNIAMTNQTSDFLQSDEDWWISTFANGNGSIYYGPVEYDESARGYAMNIGVPIIDSLTNQAIGVLRGSLDVTAMVNGLGNVKIGTTGNVVLLDAEGIVLYSQVPTHIMKQAPDEILSLFADGQSGWGQSTDMNGKPSIVAYSFLNGEERERLGWRLLLTQHQAEINGGVLRSLLISLLASLLVAGFGILISVIVMSRSIVAPLTTLTRMAQELSVGNITRGESDSLKSALQLRQDEIGAISRAFERLIQYFRAGVEASSAIANKDLTITVTPNSERDELGVAFAKMLTGLQHLIGEVAENAQAVSYAAAQLANASEQSGQATNQIALTIQQVSSGTTQQSEETSKTSSSVEQMNRAINEMARGAQAQALAVSKASSVAAQISSAVQQVTVNARSGASSASEAAEAARRGSRTIEATISGMQAIKSKVGLSAQKVREMGQRSERIDAIVETIDEIASQTDLLALNAAIEAARVETKGEKTVEAILQQHMLGIANLVAELLARGHELNSQELQTLARQARVEDLFISDGGGVIIASTKPASLGFRFSEDPRHQSAVFRSLLNKRDGTVIQPIKAREQDDKPFLFVGVSRRDRPGIIQAGMPADTITNFAGYSRGFAVVADEIRKLADHAKTATKEIAHLIRNIQKSVVEAVKVMEDGLRDVEGRSVQATEAGQSLVMILQTIEAVNRQVGEIAAAVQCMDASSGELLSAMEAVGAVVEENTAATEEMAATSNEMTQAIENIASVSEENSAAVEEVSASTEEVSAQVEEVAASAASLMDMAQNLQQIVSLFKLSLSDTNTSVDTQYSAPPMSAGNYSEHRSNKKILHRL